MSNIMMFLNTLPMLIVSGVFLAVSFVVEYIFPIAGIAFEFSLDPAWISILISGIPLAYWAIMALLEPRISSALLITIAMFAAIYIGDVFAAGEVAFIMGLGGWLEERTVEKTKKGIMNLLSLVPDTGRRIIEFSGNIKEEIVDATQLKINDIIRILPGEKFAADGIIISGATTVDQSIMTGESLPVDKTIDDEVFAGTINRFGSVDVRLNKSFENSSLQKMIKLVEEAEEHKAPMQKIVDVWASWLVPTACVIAIITYLIFTYIFNNPDAALIRAVTVLVVFCPCALALATPTSIVAAIGQAAKYGVLIKSGEALERMGKINAIAFDKTGTLTHGKLSVTEIKSLGLDEKEFLNKVASLEAHSEHPIAKAINSYAKLNNINIQKIDEFTMLAGQGIKAKLNGNEIICGNEKLVEAKLKTAIMPEILQEIRNLQNQGKAIVLVIENTNLIGYLALSDIIKESSLSVVNELNKAGIDRTILLTGDNENAAGYIAKQVGISELYSSLLPQDKAAKVKELTSNGLAVAMIGDGVNDAPALKTASVGIAMGSMGSDIAIDAADIALMGDDISKISYIKRLSNATIYSIKFNITMAMMINFVAICLSVTGYLTPVTGALVHNAGSVLVVLNAARLYDKKFI